MSRLFKIYQLNCFNGLLPFGDSHCMDRFTIRPVMLMRFESNRDKEMKAKNEKKKKLILVIRFTLYVMQYHRLVPKYNLSAFSILVIDTNYVHIQFQR